MKVYDDKFHGNKQLKSKTIIQHSLYSLYISITNYAFLEVSQFPPHRYKPYLPPPLRAVICQNVLRSSYISHTFAQLLQFPHDPDCHPEDCGSTFLRNLTADLYHTTRRPRKSRQNVLPASHIVFPSLQISQLTHLLCVRHETHNTVVPCVTLSRQPHAHLPRCSTQQV